MISCFPHEEILDPFRFMLMAVCGWMNQQQLIAACLTRNSRGKVQNICGDSFAECLWR
jgi:hypothetical protein